MTFELDSLKNEMNFLAARHESLAQQLQTERQSRIQTQIGTILAAQKIKQPGQLATLLLAEGALVEERGELRVRTANGLMPIEEGLSVLLESEAYQHFKPTVANPENDQGGPILKNGERMPTDEELKKALQNPNSSELFKELDALMEAEPKLTTPRPGSDPLGTGVQTTLLVDTLSDLEINNCLNNPNEFAKLLAKFDS